MDPLLALALGLDALHAQPALERAAYAAHLDAWSLPLLGAAVLATVAACTWSVLEATRPAPAVGQLWTDTGRAIRGLTIRVTAVTPGRVQAVIARPPRAALHDTSGRVMELAVSRWGTLRGFRLVAGGAGAAR